MMGFYIRRMFKNTLVYLHSKKILLCSIFRFTSITHKKSSNLEKEILLKKYRRSD